MPGSLNKMRELPMCDVIATASGGDHAGKDMNIREMDDDKFCGGTVTPMDG